MGSSVSKQVSKRAFPSATSVSQRISPTAPPTSTRSPLPGTQRPVEDIPDAPPEILLQNYAKLNASILSRTNKPTPKESNELLDIVKKRKDATIPQDPFSPRRTTTPVTLTRNKLSAAQLSQLYDERKTASYRLKPHQTVEAYLAEKYPQLDRDILSTLIQYYNTPEVAAAPSSGMQTKGVWMDDAAQERR